MATKKTDDLEVDGDLKIKGNLFVKGNLSVGGDAPINGVVFATEVSTISPLEALSSGVDGICPCCRRRLLDDNGGLNAVT